MPHSTSIKNSISDLNLNFKLDNSNINNIFPFYILLDENLMIIEAGKSILKMLPDLRLNKSFTEYFSVIKPYKDKIDVNDFDSLCNRSLVFSPVGKNNLILRGQIEKKENFFIFLGSPWLTSYEELKTNNLEIEDFAFHDPIQDVLQFFNTQKTNNEELKKLIETVDKQNLKLKIDQEELQKLSLVASANKNGVVFTSPQGDIFWHNESFANLTGLSSDEILGVSLVEFGRNKLLNKSEICKMVDAFYNENSFDLQFVYHNKMDGDFFVKITGQPIFDDYGEIVQYFAIIEDITCMKDKEEQLQTLSSIAEININPVSILDKDGIIEWVNISFLELNEFSLDEAIGKKSFTLLSGLETDPKTVNYIEEQIKHGLPLHCEIVNYTKSKKKYWARIQGQAIHDQYGNVIKYFIIQEDISFEIEYNQQLIESENRLNSLITNLHSGILFEGINRKILLVNPEFCSLFGIEADPNLLKELDAESVNIAIKDFFKKPQEFLLRSQEIIKNKENVYGEVIELNDGRIVELNYTVILNGEKIDGYLWSYEDITFKMKYREGLIAEKEKYSNIVANMNMGLLEVDNNDTIQLVNQSFINMSGFAYEELIGKKSTELYLNENGDLLFNEKVIDRAINATSSYEIVVSNKAGEKKYWLVSSTPSYNVNGEIIGSIGIHLDISEQKKLELHKEKLLNKLEIQNKQLNEYAHMVSHDLKAPLRSIHALITWIKEDNDTKFNEDTLEYFKLIEDKVEKMDNLIQGILTYSKLDSTNQINEDINLNEVIENIIDIIHLPSNIRIIIENKLPILRTDSFKIQQLFQNIISNAVSYNDKEKGLVKISFSETENSYVFSIDDNGPGIEEKYHAKIFDLFQSYSNDEKASGIGLSIVKRIVNSFNGKVWITSKMGEGTTFFIKLPKKSCNSLT
ncbi:PAS domain S-box protein [Flavobacterium capsici]|uniref:PAS domain S-box protein n=1 Tax=Flavobacterium capsici TaxID=3075618 RepID=A0AA96F0E6_9FLAO|nr:MULTISPECIES: PAS domain S-box protein [unclassified Flavobacterium]WNM18875.1 PAS domain S-box protein [Flavobacterium sp. PMR2A8]WNM22925.1 PAS domain S-box protein [Flavobacterium sp. PMTSA4]